MKDIIVQWKVDDGTLRPKAHFIEVLKTTAFSHEAWDCMDEQERIDIIDELVQDDFNEKVSTKWEIRTDLQ
jgi:hypothetical protein